MAGRRRIAQLRHRSGADAAGQRGIALVVVLGIAILLSLVALTLTERARTTSSLLASHIASAQAEALADAGVHHAAAALIEALYAGGSEGPPHPYSYVLALDGGQVQVDVADEDGKIDLREAPPALLANLFIWAGASEDQASGIAEAIAYGREAAYAAAGPDVPDGGLSVEMSPFPTVGALRAVPGVDEELYRRVRPYVTVFGQGPGLDPEVAALPVLLSMPGIDELLAARLEAGDETALDALSENDASAELIYTTRQSVYGVRAEAWLPNGARFVREAVVELTGDPVEPFLVLSWQVGEGRST